MNENSPPRDHVVDDAYDDEAQGSLERNLKARSTWLRLFFMLVVLLLYAVSRVVTGAVIVIQFFTVLFKGQVNESLQSLGQSLATYSYQIVRYLTYNTEERPYPFDREWPSGEPPDLRAGDRAGL